MNPELPAELAALLAATPKVSESMRQRLRKAGGELERDSEFQAECLKGQFVNAMLEAMKEQGLTQSDVARRWGRTRQYVHKLLNEDRRVNFTLETVVELAMLLGCRVELRIGKAKEAGQEPRSEPQRDAEFSLEEPKVRRLPRKAAVARSGSERGRRSSLLAAALAGG